MLIPLKRGLGAPPVDAEFVAAFERYERLQAAARAASGTAAAGSSASAAAVATGKGFTDGMAAWLSPQTALHAITESLSNLGSASIPHLAGLLAIPAGVFLLLRRR